MMTLIKEVQEADIVITISYRNGIKAIKNRSGDNNIKLDLAEILEILQEYQPDVLKKPIDKWIKEAKSYLNMKAFW